MFNSNFLTFYKKNLIKNVIICTLVCTAALFTVDIGKIPEKPVDINKIEPEAVKEKSRKKSRKSNKKNLNKTKL